MKGSFNCMIVPLKDVEQAIRTITEENCTLEVTDELYVDCVFDQTEDADECRVNLCEYLGELSTYFECFTEMGFGDYMVRLEDFRPNDTMVVFIPEEVLPSPHFY